MYTLCTSVRTSRAFTFLRCHRNENSGEKRVRDYRRLPSRHVYSARHTRGPSLRQLPPASAPARATPEHAEHPGWGSSVVGEPGESASRRRRQSRGWKPEPRVFATGWQVHVKHRQLSSRLFSFFWNVTIIIVILGTFHLSPFNGESMNLRVEVNLELIYTSFFRILNGLIRFSRLSLHVSHHQSYVQQSDKRYSRLDYEFCNCECGSIFINHPWRMVTTRIIASSMRRLWQEL